MQPPGHFSAVLFRNKTWKPQFSSFVENVNIRPRPHYTVFKRKRYCFVPFSKRFASTLIISVPFLPVHTTTRIRIQNALKPILLSSLSILPPLLSSTRDKLKSSHYAEVRPGLVQNHLVFSGLRPSRFYYPRSDQSWQAKKLYNVLFSSFNQKVVSTGLNVCPLSWILTVEWSATRWCCCGDVIVFR